MTTLTSPMRGVFAQQSRYQLLPSGQWVDYSVQSVASSLLLGTCSVTRNSDPNWKAKIRLRQNATLPYFYQTWEQTPSVSRCEAVEGKSVRSFDTTIRTGFEGWFPLTRTDSVLLDQVVASLKRKLSSKHVGSSSLGAPLAELKEVRGLFHATTSLIGDTLLALHDLKRTRGRRAAKYASKKWLEMNFGLLPLISDINSGIKSIATYLNRCDRPVRITSHASRDFRGFYKGSSVGAYGTMLDLAETYDSVLSYRLVGGFNLNLSCTDSGGYTLRDHLGLTLCDLPSVLWELTAFSWVVDYAATVGPWLDDLFYSPPGELKYLSLNRRFEVKCRGDYKYRPTSAIILSASNTASSARLFEFERSSMSVLPHAALRLRTVDEVGNFGISKVLNLASVLAGRKL